MKRTLSAPYTLSKNFSLLLVYVAATVILVGCMAMFAGRAGAIPGNVVDTLKQKSGVTNKVSPNSNLFILSNPNSPHAITAHDFWHVMRIDEGAGSVIKIELNAYHNGEKAAERALYRITATDVCGFIDTIGGAHSLTVELNGKEIESFNTNNSPKACSDFNNFSFRWSDYKSKGVPAPTDLPNTALFYNEIVFKLNGDEKPTGGNHRVRFRVEGPDKTRFSFTRGSGAREFGVVGGLTTPGLDASVGIPFGLSCNATVAQPNQEIKVYDPDPSFGDTYIFVMRRLRTDKGDWTKWTKIPDDGDASYRFGDTWHDFTTWQDSSNQWKITGAGSSGSIAKITIKKLEPEYQYMLVYFNPFDTSKTANGGTNPANNLLSFSLPGQSIFGQIGCDEPEYRLKPHLDIDPARQERKIMYYANNFAAKARVTKHPASVANDGTHSIRLTKAIFSAKPTNLAELSEGEEDTALEPCAYIGTVSRISCDNNAGSATYPTSTETGYVAHENPVVPIGYYVCFMASVQRPVSTESSSLWSHSNMECAVSGIMPKIQVRGGDARVNGLIETSLTNLPTGTYGSGGEYGVLSRLANAQMGSGAGLLPGPSSAIQSSWSNLTFGNRSGYGGYGDLPIPDIPGGRVIERNDPTLNSLNDIAGGSQQRVVVAKRAGTGALTITDDLIYDLTAGSVKEIPKIVIVADDIVIANNVERIDAWLITRGPNGRLATCDDALGGTFNPAAVLDSSVCGERIVFNAPVITSHLFLYRTYDDELGRPAETFNLRADSILSSYSGSSGVTSPIATTNSVIELPPRF